jgi:hypothetical protein
VGNGVRGRIGAVVFFPVASKKVYWNLAVRIFESVVNDADRQKFKRTYSDNCPAEIIVDLVVKRPNAVFHLIVGTRRLEHECVGPCLTSGSRSGWRNEGTGRRQGSGGGEILTRSISGNTLQGNFLHLANGPSVFQGDATFVHFSNDECAGGYARKGVRKNDLTAIGDRLRAS